MITKTSTQNKGGFLNVLMRKPSNATKTAEPERRIICSEGITSSDKAAVIKFYQQLVPGDKTRTINVDMIMNEGFQAFESTVGEASFRKIKKYFGIGCRPSKNGIKELEIIDILTQLRTVENAQYYIDGYGMLLEDVASRLHGAPEEMTVLEKAKFMRMYFTIFVGYYFFAHDFKRTLNLSNGMVTIEVDFAKAIKNNPQTFYPEDLFTISKILVENFEPDTMLYDMICYELERLDKKVLKDVMAFAELRIEENGRFVSVNVVPRHQTFSTLRTLKKKIHPEMGVYPMEIFACSTKMKESYFEDLYQLYKILKVTPIENYKTTIKKESYLEGAREVLGDRVYYEIGDNFSLSGQTEIDRFICMIEYMAGNDFVLKSANGKEYNLGVYMPVFNFMHSMKYVDVTVDPVIEIIFADYIVALDKDGTAISDYRNGKITDLELREKLGITEDFEQRVFGIEKKLTPTEKAIKFAVDNGYVESAEEISQELLENVVMAGNEVTFEKFANGEIDEATLKSRIGFEEEYAEMYFNLRKVDAQLLENRLHDMKRGMAKRNEMRRSALMISLYCYLVENQIPCGSKNKAPKRNKGLKPANLKAQIE